MITRDVLLGLDFLTPFFNMGNVVMGFYDQNSRVTRVAFVGAEVLFSVVWR